MSYRGYKHFCPISQWCKIQKIRSCDLDLWPITLKSSEFLAVVEIHVCAKFHSGKCSILWVIMLTEKQKNADENNTVVAIADNKCRRPTVMFIASKTCARLKTLFVIFHFSESSCKDDHQSLKLNHQRCNIDIRSWESIQPTNVRSGAHLSN